MDADKKDENSKQTKISPREETKLSPQDTNGSIYVEHHPNPFDKKNQAEKHPNTPTSPSGSSLKPESARSGQVTPKTGSGQVTPRSISDNDEPEYAALPEEDGSEDEEDDTNPEKKDRKKHFKGLKKYLKAIAHKKSPRSKDKDTADSSAPQTPHTPASNDSNDSAASSGTTSPDHASKWMEAKSAWAKKTAKSTAEIKRPVQRPDHKKQTSADYDRVDMLITPAALTPVPTAGTSKDAQLKKLSPRPKDENGGESGHKKRRAAKSHTRSKSMQVGSDKESDFLTSSSGEFQRLKDDKEPTSDMSSSSSKTEYSAKQGTKRLSWNHAEPNIVVTNPFLQTQSSTKREKNS